MENLNKEVNKGYALSSVLVKNLENFTQSNQIKNEDVLAAVACFTYFCVKTMTDRNKEFALETVQALHYTLSRHINENL